MPSVTRDPQKNDTISTTDSKTGAKTLFSIPKVCKEESGFVFADPFVLAKGARVVVNIYGVHQNPELWPEPLKVVIDKLRVVFAFVLSHKVLAAAAPSH